MSERQIILLDKIAIPLVFVIGLLSATITGTLAYSAIEKRVSNIELKQEIYMEGLHKSIASLVEAQEETNKRLFEYGFKRTYDTE